MDKDQSVCLISAKEALEQTIKARKEILNTYLNDINTIIKESIRNCLTYCTIPVLPDRDKHCQETLIKMLEDQKYIVEVRFKFIHIYWDKKD